MNIKRKRRSIKRKRRSIKRKDGRDSSNPIDDLVPLQVKTGGVDSEIINLTLTAQNEYSDFLLKQYREGFKNCKAENLKKIEAYLKVLRNKFDQWEKNDPSTIFIFNSDKMHFNLELRYTFRSCKDAKFDNNIALNIMNIGFFNTDHCLKKLIMLGNDKTVNEKIIKEFKNIDEVKFDMHCNIFLRVIELFIEKLSKGRVLYLENVYNACWQQVLEDMGFKKCTQPIKTDPQDNISKYNGLDYYLIKT
jgi:hypothetical protein